MITLSSLILIVIFIGAFVLFNKNDTATQTSTWQSNNNTKLEATVSALLESSDKQLREASKLAQQPNKETYSDQILMLIQGALSDARRATNAQPEASATWYQLGKVYKSLIGSQQGAVEMTEESLLRAIEVDQNNYFLYFDLGQFYISQQQFYKAETSLLKSIGINSTYANSYYNLGFVYKQLGEKEKARDAYLNAKERLEENHPNRKVIDQELQSL